MDKLKFDEQGLIPAIVVDAENKKVLTLAYMNRESLEIIHAQRAAPASGAGAAGSSGARARRAAMFSA